MRLPTGGITASREAYGPSLMTARLRVCHYIILFMSLITTLCKIRKFVTIHNSNYAKQHFYIILMR